MRVTFSSFPNSLADQLGSLASRQNKLQMQAASGQRVRLPEDDPAATRRLIDLQSEGRSVQQYKANIDRLHETATASHETMRSLMKISGRAGEIATLADGLKSPQQMAVFAAEVTEMIKQAVQLMNGKHRGEHLFAGLRGDQPPFALATNASGHVTGVIYQGDASVPEAEIAEGTTLSVRVPGANSAGSGPRGLITDAASGADFFNHLISLQNNLLAGDTEAIASVDRQQLEKDEENIIFHLSANGAVQARLEAAASVNSQRSMAVESMVSKEADADLAQTLMRFAETQNAYRAALQSAGSILNMSLLDYIR